MAQKVTDSPTTYEYEAPTNRTPDGDVEEQDWRDQLFAVSVGLVVAAMAIFPLRGAGVIASLFAVIGGISIGIGWERYRVMAPEGGLLGVLSR